MLILMHINYAFNKSLFLLFACYQERRGLTSTLSLLGSWSEELQGWGLFYPWSLTFLLDLEPSLGREGDLDVAEPHNSCGSDIM